MTHTDVFYPNYKFKGMPSPRDLLARMLGSTRVPLVLNQILWSGNLLSDQYEHTKFCSLIALKVSWLWMVEFLYKNSEQKFWVNS